AVVGWQRRAQCLGDPPLELRRHVVAALGGDDLAQLHLEVEPLRAWRALVEVPPDGPAPPDGQLAVEVAVDPVDRLVAVHGGALTPSVTSGFGRRLWLRHCRDQAAFAT